MVRSTTSAIYLREQERGTSIGGDVGGSIWQKQEREAKEVEKQYWIGIGNKWLNSVWTAGKTVEEAVDEALSA